MSKLATNTQTTNRINSETLPELLRKINALPDAGSGGDEAVIEALNITENGTYNATETVDGYAPITVNVPIPDGYIQPEGTKTITENGTYDVTEFASAVVEVPTGGGDDTLDDLISANLVEITSNAYRIGSYCFYEQLLLETASFPLATDSVGEHSFELCSKLTTVDLPLVTKMYDYTFSECKNLKVVNAPLVTQLNQYAFNNCSALVEVDFPLVTLIGQYAFNNCSALVEVDFPLATAVPMRAFNSCSRLTTANFPSATAIRDYAFYSCSSLTTTNFPLVTSLGSSAFNRCSKLETADFPLVTSVGAYAFYYGYSLTALILRSETMATLSNKNAFENCYHILGTKNSTYNPTGAKDGYIYVPRALVDSYKVASNWSTYATQFRALEDYTVDGTTTGELDPSKI